MHEPVPQPGLSAPDGAGANCAWAPARGHFLGAQHGRNARKTAWVLALCAVTIVAEIAAGLLFGSMALLADGLHMATHAGVMLVAAAASAMALGATALFLAIESGERLFDPVPIAFGEAIPVAFLGLVVNLLSIWLLHDQHDHGPGHDHRHHHQHHHDHHDHDHDHDHDHRQLGHAHEHREHTDLNLRAAYVHVVADAGLGVLAIASLFAARELGWLWLDPVLGLLAAVVILRWAVHLLRAAGATLLDKVPDGQLAARARTILEEGGGELVDFHLWPIGPGHYALLASLAEAPHPASHYRHRLGAIPSLSHVTIELADRKAGR